MPLSTGYKVLSIIAVSVTVNLAVAPSFPLPQSRLPNCLCALLIVCLSNLSDDITAQ